MSDTAELTQRQRELIRRYLIWFYKTTKEELDKIDRYFTQAAVDEFLIGRLKESEAYGDDVAFRKSVDNFITYAEEKLVRAQEKKFADASRKTHHPDYLYLKARFGAIEDAIRYFLGQEELDKICALYEQEMTERILKAREHS